MMLHTLITGGHPRNEKSQARQEMAESRGGKRDGAGRKAAAAALQRAPITIRLPAWLIEEIDGMELGRREVIEAALIKAYKLKSPF